MAPPRSTTRRSRLLSTFKETGKWTRALSGGRGLQCLQGTPEAGSVALMCFVCAEEWLRDYRIPGGGSFITKGDMPSSKFRNPLAADKVAGK
eukprot:4675435-Amphidinium_carterae.1